MAQQHSQNPEQPPQASLFLIQQWIAAGMVSAAARFIPIPFVDAMVRSQCRRFVVSRTLASHDVSISSDHLKPYYGGGGGCLSGCAAKVLTAPLTLLLFPIRKVVGLITSIRGVPLEILRMVLLGRTLDRYLREGRISRDAKEVRDVAARMRVAFHEAFARIDFRVVRAAMSDSLSGVSGWQAAAIATAKKIANQKQASQDDLATQPKLDAGAARVQETLARPETLELFAEFDRRFDEAFERTG